MKATIYTVFDDQVELHLLVQLLKNGKVKEKRDRCEKGRDAGERLMRLTR